jgi:hypothetical protein
MSDNNGWADRPGVPLNPAEPGFHWVESCDGTATVVFWRGHGGDTHYENGDSKELNHWSGHPMWQAKEWTYLGPCLTPAEVDAQANDALKWRDAINDALTEWHDPPRDGETPKAALRRLVHTEILAALDPAASRPAADLVAQARREALEEAAQFVETHTYVTTNSALKHKLVPYARAKRGLHHATIAAFLRALPDRDVLALLSAEKAPHHVWRDTFAQAVLAAAKEDQK